MAPVRYVIQSRDVDLVDPADPGAAPENVAPIVQKVVSREALDKDKVELLSIMGGFKYSYIAFDYDNPDHARCKTVGFRVRGRQHLNKLRPINIPGDYVHRLVQIGKGHRYPKISWSIKKPDPRDNGKGKDDENLKVDRLNEGSPTREPAAEGKPKEVEAGQENEGGQDETAEKASETIVQEVTLAEGQQSNGDNKALKADESTDESEDIAAPASLPEAIRKMDAED